MAESTTTTDPASLPLPPSADPQTAEATVPEPLLVEGETVPADPEETLSSEDSFPPAAQALIASLRSQLGASQQHVSTQATKLSSLADLAVEHSQLKDQHAFVSAAKEAVEAQLKEEVKKREFAEESVEMLRGQVEQARRGVMALQKQDADRKRMSLMSGMNGLGLGVPQQGEEEVLASTSEQAAKDVKASRRTSMMARSHRRISSQSEPSEVSASLDRQSLVSPNIAGQARLGGLRELRLSSTPPTATHPSPSPPAQPNTTQASYFDESVTQAALQSAVTAKAAALEDANQLRSELRRLQSNLAESEESRIATEVCLKALREFMASHEGGEGGESAAEALKGISLPPLPTDRDPDEPLQQEAKGSGWGFKLWATGAKSPLQPPSEAISPGRSRAASVATSNTHISPLPTPNEEGTPLGLSGFVSSWTKGVSAASPQNATSPNAAPVPAPANAKLSVGGGGMGSFFRRRTAESVNDKELPAPPIAEDAVDISSPVLRTEDDKEADRRRSNATTLSDLEAELGTPHGSLEAKPDGELEGAKGQFGELERLDEVEI
ncbi:hypothetical protein B9479_006518 [Cryptococcus floricola]|uniref:Uncharacterized protein n=1 Tax=Cryptococcus floricola TaxID=2591691 RepID=A0A5D3ARX2_9TREE|nr:hypothetical protein B9479_006518 [Cryptococcus floricola]